MIRVYYYENQLEQQQRQNIDFQWLEHEGESKFSIFYKMNIFQFIIHQKIS